ncbi:RNA polymerase sigma factor RpoH [Minicystis rosea]|nr:RNA polymerase sigma factor RpoH [Minicystis rosea]
MLSRYRIEVARRERLAPAVEQDLAHRYRSGDRSVAQRLIEGCLAAVIAIALEYRRCGLPIEDLVQEGNIGLLKAIDRFDPCHGVRLAAYAGYWIRAEIRAYVVRHYRIVRLGSTKGEQRAIWLYRKTREARPEALAEMSGASLERVLDLLPLLLANDVSLSPASHDDGGSPLDRLDARVDAADEVLGNAEDRARLRAAITELSAREQDIVRRRLLAEEPATLETLGSTWGVSKERVRQIEERAKARLRERIEQAAADGGVPARERRPRRARVADLRGDSRAR